jgi:hypothetical protein
MLLHLQSPAYERTEEMVRILMCLAALVACICGLGVGNEVVTQSSYEYPRTNFLLGLAGLIFFYVYKDKENMRTFAGRSLYRASPAVAGYGFGYYYAVKAHPVRWMYDLLHPENEFLMLAPLSFNIIFLFLGLTPVMILIYDQVIATKGKNVV